MGKLQDGTTPWIDFEVGVAPSTPAAGLMRVYAKTGDSMAQKDDAGVETLLDQTGGGGGGGTVDYLHYRDEKTSGTDAGTFTSGSWQTRVLTTEVADTGGNGSLASNQITLVAGTYIVRAWAPAYNVSGHRLRLQNITDSTTILLGSSTYAVAASQNHAHLMGVIVLAGSKVLELQHRCESTQSGNGLGAGGAYAGVVEVYASIEFEKIA